MHIETLALNGYRGAHDLELTLHPKLNVFYGVNGCGKTTLLDAAAVMLSWAVNRIRHAGAAGRKIQEADIANGKPAAALELSVQTKSGSVAWKLVKTRQGHSNGGSQTLLTGLNEFVKGLQAEITSLEEQVNLPLFVYYPVNRTVLDIPLRIREKHRFNLLAAYDEALTSGANFRTFFEWFREREDLENENRKYAGSLFEMEGVQYPDPQLEAVRRALQHLMPDFKNLTVRRNPLRMEVDKSGQKLTVIQLSDGEKCLMALAGDLARRMAIANPLRANPLEGEGIVLIDEIDLHLHPIWQRMIVPKLMEVLPNCQFLISTHSPHVLTHVQPESLHLLTLTGQGLQAERPTESYGKNVDRILEDLMGLNTTRPDQVSAGIHDLFVTIDQKRLDEARRKISKLKAEIGEDPELVKAEVLIICSKTSPGTRP